MEEQLVEEEEKKRVKWPRDKEITLEATWHDAVIRLHRQLKCFKGLKLSNIQRQINQGSLIDNWEWCFRDSHNYTQKNDCADISIAVLRTSAADFEAYLRKEYPEEMKEHFIGAVHMTDKF